MKRDYQIWNILHDGEITKIDGALPGDLVLKVMIDYISNRLPGKNEYLKVVLRDCTLFEYEFWETKDKTTFYRNLADIQNRPPIVLSCEESKDLLLIDAACGQIKTKYDKASIFLANGDKLSFEELENEATEYWDEWSRQTNT